MLKQIEKTGSIKKYHGIISLRLVGSPYDIGFQHGKLLKEQIKDGIYKYFSEQIAKLVKNDKRFRADPINKVVVKFLKSKAQKFVHRIPEEIKQEIKGISEGAEIDYKSALEIYVFPEVMSYLISKSYKENYSFKTYLSGASLMGCTSILAYGDATNDNTLLHGRNLDSIGIGYWDKYTTVFHVEPNDGFKYVSVGSAGMAGAVISGMNEKGITYALHQNYTKEIDENNMPILALGTMILKHADTLSKAQEIIKSAKTVNGWSVVVSDSKIKDGFIAEMCASKIYFRSSDRDLLVCTNSYLSPELYDKEIIISPLLNISSNIRYQRAIQLAGKSYYNIKPQDIAQWLGDRYDLSSEKEKIFGYTISQNNTVGSVIFSPDRKTLWVANGDTPTCNNEYIPFHLDYDIEISESFKLKAYEFENKDFKQVMRNVIEAHKYNEKTDYKKSEEIIMDSIKLLDKQEPVLQFLCGILNIKIGNYEKAAKMFNVAYDNETDIYKCGIIKLWMGRIYDLLNNRDKALKQYKYVEQMGKNIYGDIVELALQGIKKPYTKKSIKHIDLDIWFGEELIPK